MRGDGVTSQLKASAGEAWAILSTFIKRDTGWRSRALPRIPPLLSSPFHGTCSANSVTQVTLGQELLQLKVLEACSKLLCDVCIEGTHLPEGRRSCSESDEHYRCALNIVLTNYSPHIASYSLWFKSFTRLPQVLSGSWSTGPQLTDVAKWHQAASACSCVQGAEVNVRRAGNVKVWNNDSPC